MGKRAVLVGCNYPGSNCELRGCINDVHSINNMLVNVYGFQQSDIVLMLDTDANTTKPTGAAVKVSTDTVETSVPCLTAHRGAFFQFSLSPGGLCAL